MAKLNGQFIPVPRWVLEYLGKDAVALCVLIHALTYMSGDRQEITTSYDHLAELTGYDRRTVIRAMNRIEASGAVVKTVRKSKTGRNMTNLYQVDFNNPITRSSVTGDTISSVTGDTSGVSLGTPSEGVTADTQSREINLNLEGKQKRKKKDALFLSDPRWQRQLKTPQ
jgi:hypothetical protein